MSERFDNIKQKLTNKYRLILMNEGTYEELVAFKLSRLNVFLFATSFALIIFLITSLMIAYTPLREYVPGYTSNEVQNQSARLIDSLSVLEQRNFENTIQLNVIRKVITGEIKPEEIQGQYDSIIKVNLDSIHKKDVYASKEDSIFRKNIEQQDKYNIIPNEITNKSIVFFPPVKGTITSHYNTKELHFGTDIAVPKNAPIKSVEDGTVIFAEWSADTGFVIIIDHGKSIISVYKHNALLYKKEGDFVKSGEIIAAAGSEGKLSTATHLHFELWYNGYPIDASKFIPFE